MEKFTHPATLAAKLVRQDLKAAFPSRKFAVRSSVYSMGSEILVICDSDIVAEVETLVAKYGSQKGIEIDDCPIFERHDHPQARFISVEKY